MNRCISPLISERKMAALLGISHRTLQAKRLGGSGPPHYRLPNSHTVRYDPTVVQAWLEACAVPSDAIVEDGNRKG
ncbi:MULTISPECIES: helix-turn-helix transcriptional regulator [Thiorhodovibrio]|uniref:helix-turn-helix transcriptional regulator n=1 Tax=Thiorhodovibrio TaxID=61593 RepID=UPI001911FC16|nr:MULTISPECIES: hypothetical protein [Thiorhodovibrio]MBK5969043.1 hypothetical protein [Thiorhodovibrio winogradskyi]WPL15075.1 hypothetical protein Thiosp_04939 [Thiorhodovibrio litoralis]